jgi:hypothetical protein
MVEDEARAALLEVFPDSEENALTPRRTGPTLPETVADYGTA